MWLEINIRSAKTTIIPYIYELQILIMETTKYPGKEVYELFRFRDKLKKRQVVNSNLKALIHDSARKQFMKQLTIKFITSQFHEIVAACSEYQ